MKSLRDYAGDALCVYARNKLPFRVAIPQRLAKLK